jgi:hypothetical protein
MYLEILNENMVGYANTSARDMLDRLFDTYGNITSVDLEINFQHMHRGWDPQQPVETLFKQIQDCANYSEAGGVPIGPSQQINVGYENIFATGHFMSACRRWNEKPAAEKTWTHFKYHFTAAHHQHKQIQEEYAAHAVYHSANAAMTQNEDQVRRRLHSHFPARHSHNLQFRELQTFEWPSRCDHRPMVNQFETN